MKVIHPLPLCAALLLSACVHSPWTTTGSLQQASASKILHQATKPIGATSQRAALYLAAADQARQSTDRDSQRIYNRAAAELAVLLRDSEQGRLWNRSETVSYAGHSYDLTFAKPSRNGATWDPAYFTKFLAADGVKLNTLDRPNRREGWGGTLVGIRQSTPVEPFATRLGVTAPVTCLLEFSGRKATLSLVQPDKQPSFKLGQTQHPVAADFSAPLAAFPHESELWNGLMGALRVSQYMGTTGLYMLHPYDPDRTPLVFVHGLISTARMWRNVVNELEMDPQLRSHYQPMLFAYPTGNPPAYSALRLRQELARFKQLHPDMKPPVLVGHSMGGLVSRMQTTTLTRESWNVLGNQKARKLFASIPPGSLVDRALRFDANPHIGRVVFICTPHRGSEMAQGTLGGLARRLITLPVELTSTFTGTVGNSIAILTGDPKHMPNSVSGLSPRNPTLSVLDQQPIKAPFHSIIGDRGKGNSPNSSDGVVAYWSSHLAGAQSEKIVPGPHGACELPETLAELRRILHLQLQKSARAN